MLWFVVFWLYSKWCSVFEWKWVYHPRLGCSHDGASSTASLRLVSACPSSSSVWLYHLSIAFLHHPLQSYNQWVEKVDKKEKYKNRGIWFLNLKKLSRFVNIFLKRVGRVYLSRFVLLSMSATSQNSCPRSRLFYNVFTSDEHFISPSPPWFWSQYFC